MPFKSSAGGESRWSGRIQKHHLRDEGPKTSRKTDHTALVSQYPSFQLYITKGQTLPLYPTGIYYMIRCRYCD